TSLDAYNSIVRGDYVHGYNMANLTVGLATPGTAKNAIAITELALPRFSETHAANPGHSGYVGTQTDVARAIKRAVDEWKKHSESRLVINLSLGWECSVASPDTQAAYAAIKHAVCTGALVVAAAGNQTSDANVTGPMCPGAWERLPAPTDCDAFEGKGPD